jgi:hypothetical protein
MTEEAQTLKEDKFYRFMRFLVISMGIVLVIGTIALLVGIIAKTNSASKEATTTEPIAKAIGTNNCIEYKQEDIPLMGKIIASENNKGILTITTSDQVIAYDLCKGKIIAKFQSISSD